MTETELKAVVDDLAMRRRRVEDAGGILEKEGYLQDRRWDTERETIGARDHVIRIRTFNGLPKSESSFEWKGPTRSNQGYKVREEIGTTIGNAEALSEIFERLGMQVTRTVDREIVQYGLDGATIRFESYPRMDVLVEVEGSPRQIERAIEAIGIPRGEYCADALADFMVRFEHRTGKRPIVCAADLDEVEW